MLFSFAVEGVKCDASVSSLLWIEETLDMSSLSGMGKGNEVGRM